MLEIREAATDEDLGHGVAIISRVSPEAMPDEAYFQGLAVPTSVPA